MSQVSHSHLVFVHGLSVKDFESKSSATLSALIHLPVESPYSARVDRFAQTFYECIWMKLPSSIVRSFRTKQAFHSVHDGRSCFWALSHSPSLFFCLGVFIFEVSDAM